jgi:hypothetical protein
MGGAFASHWVICLSLLTRWYKRFIAGRVALSLPKTCVGSEPMTKEVILGNKKPVDLTKMC